MSSHGDCYYFDHAPYGEWGSCGDDEGYEIDQGFLLLSPTRCLGASCISKNVTGPTNINFWWRHVGGELSFWVDERQYKCKNSTGESRTIPIVEDGPHMIKWKFAKGGLGQSALIDYICIGDNYKEVDLLVYKTDNPDPVIAGEYLTYNITVANFGPGDATNVIVKEKLPKGVTYFSDFPTKGSYDSNTDTWAVGNLPKGDSSTLILKVYVDPSIPDGTIISSQVDVFCTESDLNRYNNDAEVETLVNWGNINENFTTYVDKNRYFYEGLYVYDTIQKAVEHVAINGTVKVARGTYSENVVINKELKLVGDDNIATIIQGTNMDIDVLNVIANNVTIKGFTIKNGESAIHINKASNCRLIDNLIYDCSYGIIIDGGDFSYIFNNIIYNTTKNPGIDLYNSSKCMLLGNYVYNSKVASIYFEAGSNDSILESNLMSGSSDDGIIFINSNRNNLEHNNTFINIGCCDIFEYNDTCFGNIIPRNCMKDPDISGCWMCE